MKIKYNLTGSERKALVNTIGEILEVTPNYLGAPSFAYKIDGFEVDKNGTLSFDERTDSETVENLLEKLGSRGFDFKEIENALQGDTGGKDSLTIELPLDGFTDTVLKNLHNLIQSKGLLIKKALAVNSLALEQTEDTLRFPWFSSESSTEEIKAYTHFVSAICFFAKSQKRVNPAGKEVENEKYAFRCLLLRLGFIGDEYNEVRKILLKNLTGNSALKYGITKKNKEAVNGNE